jgi:hypothetical protein
MTGANGATLQRVYEWLGLVSLIGHLSTKKAKFDNTSVTALFSGCLALAARIQEARTGDELIQGLDERRRRG